MKILLVFCHPRRQSFTGSVADAFAERAIEAGHVIEFADLYAEGFDPRLFEEDEPDWNGPEKTYSDTVEWEMERMRRNEAVVLIFPVWWWSMPAMLKGWVDRVWNRGFAYGTKSLSHSHGLAIGVAAATAENFAKRGYDQSFSTQINTGIMNYCGIAHSHSEILHDSRGHPQVREALVARAQELAGFFPSGLD